MSGKHDYHAEWNLSALRTLFNDFLITCSHWSSDRKEDKISRFFCDVSIEGTIKISGQSKPIVIGISAVGVSFSNFDAQRNASSAAVEIIEREYPMLPFNIRSLSKFATATKGIDHKILAQEREKAGFLLA